MSANLFYYAIVSALAGFLFGFDTIVISGAESKIQELWQLDSTIHGLAISSALWGTVLGSIVGSVPTDRIGRKSTLLWIGILYVVSAVWSGLASGVTTFCLARFIGGLGVGISTVAAPLYIAEIAPAKHRGFLAGLFQFNIVFGILVAFLSNYMIRGTSDNDWRVMLIAEALPAVIYAVFCLGIVESPRWLIAFKGDVEAGRRVFGKIDPQKSPEQIDAMVNEVLQTTNAKPAIDSMAAKPKIHGAIGLAFFIAFFNQLSGVNAILYFAPRIFALAGMGDDAAFLQSIGIGITNFIFTFLGLWLIDRVGRRTLLLIGSLGYIASLGLCSWAFRSETFSIVPACVFGFIAAHAMGSGAVIWVFISEIFPNRTRALGQSLGSGTHWVFAALITLAFPYVTEQVAPTWIFAFFCGMMVLQLIWVCTCMPETKGTSLESL